MTQTFVKEQMFGSPSYQARNCYQPRYAQHKESTNGQWKQEVINLSFDGLTSYRNKNSHNYFFLTLM